MVTNEFLTNLAYLIITGMLVFLMYQYYFGNVRKLVRNAASTAKKNARKKTKRKR